jgi:hypothetical protein
MRGEARRPAKAWTRGIRMIVGIMIFILSCALLIWGLLPMRREVRTQPISPTELQLPTPETFHRDSLASNDPVVVEHPATIAYGVSYIVVRDPQ